jgi:hypothetical protein
MSKMIAYLYFKDTTISEFYLELGSELKFWGRGSNHLAPPE